MFKRDLELVYRRHRVCRLYISIKRLVSKSHATHKKFGREILNMDIIKEGSTGKLKFENISYMFDGCTNLTSVTFEEDSQLTSIGDYAFYNCTTIESLTIPSSVQKIEGNSFIDCSSLYSVTFENDSQLTKIGVEAFKTEIALTSKEVLTPFLGPST